jgi:ribosomal protein S11
MKKDRKKKKRERERENKWESKSVHQSFNNNIINIIKKNNKMNSITSKKIIYTFFLLVNHESA